MRSLSLGYVAFVSVVALSACGGGGGSSSGPASVKTVPTQQTVSEKPSVAKPEAQKKPTSLEQSTPLRPVTSEMTGPSAPTSPNVTPVPMASYDSLLNETIQIVEEYRIVHAEQAVSLGE